MTTIKATKQEFVNLINGLFQVQDVQGKNFSLAVSKNIEILKNKLEDLEKAATPDPKFLEIARKVNQLANEKKEDGQAEIDKLEEDNKELVEARRAQMEKVQKMMEEEIEVELNTIEEDVLPETVTAKQINGIIKIIK
tara:strand:- start:36 stop:449 length:414 start_codon:yes stop_codon:yes gene_type:complete